MAPPEVSAVSRAARRGFEFMMNAVTMHISAFLAAGDDTVRDHGYDPVELFAL